MAVRESIKIPILTWSPMRLSQVNSNSEVTGFFNTLIITTNDNTQEKQIAPIETSELSLSWRRVKNMMVTKASSGSKGMIQAFDSMFGNRVLSLRIELKKVSILLC
jgi:hypothetical protein